MTRILVRWQSPGFHNWPDAPAHRSYLADRHRHLFFFEVELDVFHDDRDIEFHDLQDWCREATPANYEYGAMSCEAIARNVLTQIEQRWPGRHPMVSVLEDNEAGAKVS